MEKDKCEYKSCKREQSLEFAPYCTEHERYFRIADAAKRNVKLCDPLRGCFEEMTGKYKHCEPCRERARLCDKANKAKKREVSAEIIETTHTTTKMLTCVKCCKPFEEFKTDMGNISKRCNPCYRNQLNQETKRSGTHTHARTRELDIDGKYGDLKLSINKCYKSNPEEKHIFTITKDQFAKIINNPCAYCGESYKPLEMEVDKIVVENGYKPDNLVPICTTCKIFKNNESTDKFVEFCYYLSVKYGLVEDKRGPDDAIFDAYLYGRPKILPYGTFNASIKNKYKNTLSSDEYNEIVLNDCYICGHKATDKDLNNVVLANNDIAIFNTKTSVACCNMCKYMKSSNTVEQMLNIALKITIHTYDLYEDIRENRENAIYPVPNTVYSTILPRLT